MERYLLKATIFIRDSSGSGDRKPLRKIKERDAFTGKLVKSMVIDSNPRLKRFFEKTSGCPPKLVHVTPLYVELEKVRCVHSLSKVNSSSRYSFYVGFIESEVVESPSFDDIYNALLNISGCHVFKGMLLDVELVSLESLDVESTAKTIVSSLAKTGKLKVVFASPTLLRDPFRTGKHKSLTPTPMNTFSTPIYINLYLAGRLRQRLFIRTLVILHRLLNEPYSVHKTTKLIWVRYNEDKTPIPALIGYVNLFLNRDYYKLYISRGLDIEELLQETFATMLAIGTGTSRATGFGHIIMSGS